MTLRMHDAAVRTAWPVALRASKFDFIEIELAAMRTFFVSIAQPP
jgi:hypothetical protein